MALFLDVDKTLTKDFIQSVYARQLGCFEKYDAIEKTLQKQEITSKEFGEQLIAVFAIRVHRNQGDHLVQHGQKANMD